MPLMQWKNLAKQLIFSMGRKVERWAGRYVLKSIFFPYQVNLFCSCEDTKRFIYQEVYSYVER